mmetsp:Transcript_9841/g.14975  ORF Transcript_9841/g.14975 Transcript_9841/m.14975 type:complete len:118 (-) Transcript_9841:53-406(-)|eukprot:CAMPEP_0202707860 /NCGR_PEP_ID=MMETSP1385-20130828/20134_1 /ASSEMBLY_ACC=CAM_ASM_000861 /TAXON_ID=933848 /ORGANISM="Elphidium margaritaceum" /LENGTH=117 /DNA_ID=CAMNT_0049366665 /DNA_START=52 /DNA_END=405 /DNA_ORIENTATION=+
MANYGNKNQYMPKASEELHDTKKAHTYQVKGSYDNKQGTLLVWIYDNITGGEFEENYTQNHFQNMQIFNVAKVVIDAINDTMKGGTPLYTIQEFNGFAYLSVNGAQIPALALPPKKN